MPPPKARICYICGRPTLLPGFDNHVQQCRDLFEKREMQKPPKERRPCPVDPMLMNPYPTKGGGSGGYSQTQIDAMNDAAQKAWEQTLARCQYCGRTFLPEKLAIHNKSCTPSNPAKRIDQSVRSSGIAEMGYGGSMEYGESNYGRGYGASSSGMGSTQSKLSSGKGASYGTNSYGDSFDNAPIGGLKATGRGNSGRRLNESSNFGNGGMKDMVDFPTYGHLIKCPDCGRNFNEVSFEKHSKICRKVFKQKRKVFDSAKARAKGTELAQYLGSNRRSGMSSTSSKTMTSRSTAGASISNRSSVGSVGSSLAGGRGMAGHGKGGLPKWKAESLSFRDAIRQAKLVSVAEKKSKQTGIPLHVLLPAHAMHSNGPDYAEMNYIQCPTCGRSFNQKAGERHIPQCKNIINKPSRLIKGSGIAMKNPAYASSTGYDYSPPSAKLSNMQLKSSDRVSSGGPTRSSFGSSSKPSNSYGYEEYGMGAPPPRANTGVNDPLRLNLGGSSARSGYGSSNLNSSNAQRSYQSTSAASGSRSSNVAGNGRTLSGRR